MIIRVQAFRGKFMHCAFRGYYIVRALCISAWARGTVGNCFRPSASLTVGLWVCGTRFVEACGQWEQGTKVYKVTRGYKDYKVRS